MNRYWTSAFLTDESDCNSKDNWTNGWMPLTLEDHSLLNLCLWHMGNFGNVKSTSMCLFHWLVHFYEPMAKIPFWLLEVISIWSFCINFFKHFTSSNKSYRSTKVHTWHICMELMIWNCIVLTHIWSCYEMRTSNFQKHRPVPKELFDKKLCGKKHTICSIYTQPWSP